jgi:hypothetical protein
MAAFLKKMTRPDCHMKSGKMLVMKSYRQVPEMDIFCLGKNENGGTSQISPQWIFRFLHIQ